SDVCSSDLDEVFVGRGNVAGTVRSRNLENVSPEPSETLTDRGVQRDRGGSCQRLRVGQRAQRHSVRILRLLIGTTYPRFVMSSMSISTDALCCSTPWLASGISCRHGPLGGPLRDCAVCGNPGGGARAAGSGNQGSELPGRRLHLSRG